MEMLRYTEFINMLKNNKIKIIFPSIMLSATLVLGGCSADIKNEDVDVSSNDALISVIDEGTSLATNQGIESAEEHEESLDADTVVEKAISGTIDLADTISEASDEFKQSEAYQQSVERLKTEFNTLVDWLMGKTEINGYTIKDVSSETVSMAKNAVTYVDGVIESYIPDYKDKAKEKLNELADTGWDLATDAGAWLLNKGQEFADEVQEKSKGL